MSTRPPRTTIEGSTDSLTRTTRKPESKRRRSTPILSGSGRLNRSLIDFVRKRDPRYKVIQDKQRELEEKKRMERLEKEEEKKKQRKENLIRARELEQLRFQELDQMKADKLKETDKIEVEVRALFNRGRGREGVLLSGL